MLLSRHANFGGADFKCVEKHSLQVEKDFFYTLRGNPPYYHTARITFRGLLNAREALVNAIMKAYFVEILDEFIWSEIFGFHFGCMDMRQGGQ